MPLTICERTFQLAAEWLSVLGYHGPLNLQCDDTRLFPVYGFTGTAKRAIISSLEMLASPSWFAIRT